MENSKAKDLEALFRLREMVNDKISSIDDTALSKYISSGQKRKWAKIDDALEKGLEALESGDWKPKARKLLEPEEDSWDAAIKKVHKRAHEIGFIETSSGLIDNLEQAFKEFYYPPVIKK